MKQLLVSASEPEGALPMLFATPWVQLDTSADLSARSTWSYLSKYVQIQLMLSALRPSEMIRRRIDVQQERERAAV
jgi:hypothetical protein